MKVVAEAKGSVDADAGLARGEGRPALAVPAAQHSPVSPVIVVATTVVVVTIVLVVSGIKRVILPSLPFEDRIEEIDVFYSESEDLVLRELLVGRMRGHEAAQLGEGSAHVLLPPALPRVGEDFPDVAVMPHDASLFGHLSKAHLENHTALARFVAVARGS